MTCTIGDGSDHRVDSIRICNDTVAITILPAAGGNISEITDLRTGHNWLWQNPHIPIGNDREGDDYGRQLDSGGWDEILLSISPGQLELPGVAGRRIDDHGDLIRQRWIAEKIKDRFGNDSCLMSVTGKTLAYDFRKVITLHREQSQLDFAYALTNNEKFSWPWYWCAHALLDARPDTRINLPEGLPYRINNEADGRSVSRGWPNLELTTQETIDLSDPFAENAGSRNFSGKFFVGAPRSGSVNIAVGNSSESFIMRFDPKIVPWLGLWINNRGWSGCDSEPYQNLGIEPSTTPNDSVWAAIENDEVSWLEPGETRKWSVSVELVA